jgi:tetratricopeptide (TPR) repeat protein
LGSSDAAAQAAGKAVHLTPLDDAGRKLHVASLLADNRFEDALASASDYVTRAPERAEAWALRAKVRTERAKVSAGDAARRAESLSGARADLLEALKRNPREPSLLRSWLAVEEQVSGYPTNVRSVRTWLDEQRHWAGFVQVARYCNERNDTNLATELFREATRVAPGEPQAWRVYAVHLESTGALAEALSAQEKLATINGNDEGALRDVARLNRKLGNTDKAVAAYRRWLLVNPDALLALNNLAAILGAQPGTLDEAVTLATRARELAPASAGVADTLGWLLFSRNRGQDRMQATTLLKQASEGQDHPVHHLHLAEVLATGGQPADAKRALALALKHADFPERRRALALSRELGG